MTLKFGMYELVMETTNKNATYDPLKYQLYVRYRDHMFLRKESTGFSTISNGGARE